MKVNFYSFFTEVGMYKSICCIKEFFLNFNEKGSLIEIYFELRKVEPRVK